MTVRVQNLLLGAFGSITSKFVIQAIQLVFIGYFSRSFSSHLFGVWSLSQQTIIFTSFLDLGLSGGAFRNQLSTKFNNNVLTKEGIDLYRCVFVLTCIFSAIFLLILCVVYLLGGFSAFLLFTGEGDTGKYVLWFFLSLVFLICRAPFLTYHSVLYANQKEHHKALLEMLASTILVILFFTVKRIVHLKNVHQFLIYFSCMLSADVFCYFIFSHYKRITLPFVSFILLLNFIKKNGAKSLLFCSQNLLSLFLFSSIMYVVNVNLGTDFAGEFNLVNRPFLLLIGVHFIFLNPMWSSIRDAYNLQHYFWVRKAFKRGLWFSTGFLLIICSIIQMTHKSLILFISGKELHYPGLVLALGIWTFIYCTANFFAIFLNAENKIEKQTIFLLLGVLIFFVTAKYFGNKFGVVGVVSCSIISILPLFFSNIFQSFYSVMHGKGRESPRC